MSSSSTQIDCTLGLDSSSCAHCVQNTCPHFVFANSVVELLSFSLKQMGQEMGSFVSVVGDGLGFEEVMLAKLETNLCGGRVLLSKLRLVL